MSALEELIDPKIISIMQLLLRQDAELFHLQMISNKTGIPISTTFRIVNKLVNLEFIERMKVGNFKIYRAASNPKTEEFGSALFGKPSSKSFSSKPPLSKSPSPRSISSKKPRLRISKRRP